MRYFRTSLIVLTVLLAALSALGQATAFTDASVEYTFQIPEEKWKAVNSGGNPEFVYGYRNEGHFDIRKVSSPRNTPWADLIREQEDKLQFLQSYVAGKQENFNGKLNGAVFNYEFVKSGRPMSGRIYFLRSGDTVYLLRFTGYQDSLRSLRAQTDTIGRTFEIKGG